MTKRAPLTFKVEQVARVPGPAATKQTAIQANTKTRKRERGKASPGREGRQFIAAHVTPEAAKQFKLLAVHQEKTTQELLVEAINDLFAKHGLSRIA